MDTSSNPPFGSNRTTTSNGPSGASEARPDVGAALERGKANLTESAGAAATDLADDLRNLRADVTRIQDTLSKHGVEIGTQASRAVKDVASSATAQAKTLASELEDMARKNPLGTLAGTLLVGMVIGLMSRSRH